MVKTLIIWSRYFRARTKSSRALLENEGTFSLQMVSLISGLFSGLLRFSATQFKVRRPLFELVVGMQGAAVPML